MGGSNFITIGAVPDAQNDGIKQGSVNLIYPGSGGGLTVVPAVAGKRISVHGMHVAPTTSAFFTVQDVSAAATVALTGLVTLGAGVPLVLPWQGYPYYTCAPGDALVFAFQGTVAATLGGAIMYVQG